MATLYTGTNLVVEGCPLSVHIPKWTTNGEFELIEPLRKLGITDLFDAARADLTGVAAGSDGLFISKVRQKATIAVDEEGTLAAAVTAMIAEAVSGEVSFGRCPSEVAVNRPFVYVIQHTGTGEVLFAGRVMNPAA